MDQLFDKYDEQTTYRHCYCCSYRSDDHSVARAMDNACVLADRDIERQRRDKENDDVDKSHLHRWQRNWVDDSRFLD